jgi:hypothetical protein
VPRVFCIETGRGPKGSIFVCSTPRGNITIRARKVAPHKYSISSELPPGYETVMYAPNRRELRKRIENWLEVVLK